MQNAKALCFSEGNGGMPGRREAREASKKIEDSGEKLNSELQSQFAAVDVELLREFMDAAEQKGHDLNAAVEAAMLTYILPVRIHRRVDSVFDGVKHVFMWSYRLMRKIGKKLKRKRAR